MMKKIAMLICILTILLSYSCMLEDNSIIEDRITEVSAAELMPGAMTQVAYNQSNLCALMAAGVVQYLSSTGSTGQTLSQYQFNANTFDITWKTGYYQGSLVNLNQMKKLAQLESNSNIEAIANILLAHEFGTITNIFGDIPLSEALRGEDNPTPQYDTQEEIYISILTLLDEAIKMSESSGIDNTLSSFDLIYQGDMQGWRKLAYGLKARYMLNQSNKDPSLYFEILDIVRNSSFASNLDQANFTFNSSSPNPLFSFGSQRPGLFIIGDYFENVMAFDPRYNSYIFENNFYFDFVGSTNLTWVQEDSPIPIFSFTEIKFMETEILHLTGGSITETSNALSEAMHASFSETCGINQDVINYINSRSNLALLTQSEDRHERIMDEAYKAYYGYGHHQTWNNFRRTGFPSISSTSNTPWEGNPSATIPRRFPYPDSEFVFNLDNLNEAIVRQQGVLLDDDIWLFK